VRSMTASTRSQPWLRPPSSAQIALIREPDTKSAA
jgi:hypothetical protein